MPDKALKDWTVADGVPRIVAGTIADATAWAAGTVVADTTRTVTALDVGKLFERLSDATYWVLETHSPVVWTPFACTPATPSALGYMTAAQAAQLAALPRVAVSTIDVSSTSITPIDISELSIPLVAGNRYTFEVNYTWQCAATTSSGAAFSVNGPAASTICFQNFQSTNAINQLGFRSGVSYDSFQVNPVAQAANTDIFGLIKGNVTPTANGNLVVRFRAGTAGSNAICRAGSRLIVYP